MKYITLNLAILLFCYWNLNAQNCCIPQTLKDKYDRDVKHLALLRMEQFNSPALKLVEVDQTWQDTIWKGLAAIYHSKSDGRNAVFNQYCIHHYSGHLSVARSMYVKLDPNASWYQNWVGGNITTNEGFIDSLLQKYGFKSVTVESLSLNIFGITTTQNLNLNALADSLEISNSIIYADAITSIIGGDERIVYQKVNGQAYFTFMIGWDESVQNSVSSERTNIFH